MPIGLPSGEGAEKENLEGDSPDEGIRGSIS